jgi:hypothetical protein
MQKFKGIIFESKTTVMHKNGFSLKQGPLDEPKKPFNF